MVVMALPPAALRATCIVAMLTGAPASKLLTRAMMPGVSRCAMISVCFCAVTRRLSPSISRISMLPPPTDAPVTSIRFPLTPLRRSRTVLGCAPFNWISSKVTLRPRRFASSRLSRSRASSAATSISPPTTARSVPCPRHVRANEPQKPTRASATSSPNSRLATRPMRAAPAVCELDGPIITGPTMSKRFISVSIASASRPSGSKWYPLSPL